jgi:hypothetical protein
VESVRKVSEGVRVDKLRRDSSFMILWEQTQEKVRTGQSFGAEEILKEENQRSRFAGEIHEVPSTVRSGRDCGGFSPQVQGESRAIGIRSSKFVEVRVLYLLKSRVTISRRNLDRGSRAGHVSEI